MRPISLLIFILALTTLQAQSNENGENWIGVNNLFFKNKDMNTVMPSPVDSNLLLHTGLLGEQFSIGFYFRKVFKEKNYHQFDLQTNKNRNKDYTIVERTNLGYTEKLNGKDIKSLDISLGYQLGGLYAITPKLTGDAGIRVFLKYNKINETPFRPSRYSVALESAGLGLNLSLGLNYKIHKNINIGYHFIPNSIALYWEKIETDNPTFTARQRIVKKLNFESVFFKNILSFRNFNLSYVF